MAVVYTTAAKVAAFLQVPVFDATTTPTATQVEDLIYRAERDIERHTNRAWRAVKTTEYDTNAYEYHDMWPHHYTYTYINKPRIYLRHQNVITPLATGSGDSMQVWNGSTWVEWVGVKTEDRNGDFWVNGDDGMIYFVRGYPIIRYPKGIRLKYRYGQANVDPWVEDVATKLVAIEIVSNFKQYAYTTPELSRANIDSTLARWKQECKEKLDETTWLAREKRPLIL